VTGSALAVPVFVAGVLVSLSTSWLLVSRLERLGERFGLSEALLGMVAALAADTPEITSAITALVHHEQAVGAGVAIGSNVFNLAGLLGLGAVVAGEIALHRRVVVLGGAVGAWVAVACLAAVFGIVSPAAGFALTLAVLVPYVAILSVEGRGLGRLSLPPTWTAWLVAAVAEEEIELSEAIRPPRGRPRDACVAAAALVAVVGASVAMERAASALGRHYAVPQIVVGGLVLAVITSLPNAVAAIYLAARGRGAAVLSTALNSNSLNVAFGLLLPAAVTGLDTQSGAAALVAAWYTGLTVLALGLAYRDRGLHRSTGWLVIAAYLVFVATLLGQGS
jgi:cation:H+ antiporter